MPRDFVQINQSDSRKNVIHALHFQWDPPMGKLMRVVRETEFLMAVDLRRGSPTVRKWFGTEVSGVNGKRVWAPESFARGFCALCDFAIVEYQCTGIYRGQGEAAIRWNDPAIGVEWPVADPLVSEKDQNAHTLADWLASSHSEQFKFPTT